MKPIKYRIFIVAWAIVVLTALLNGCATYEDHDRDEHHRWHEREERHEHEEGEYR